MRAARPQGAVRKARAGLITHFTGIDSPYQRPRNPDVRLSPQDSVDAQARQVIAAIDARR